MSMPPDILAPLIAVITVAASFVLVLRGPLGKALARRIEGSRMDEDAAERLSEVETRLMALEGAQERILELEERLDFAERLLARDKAAALKPGSET